MRNVSTSKRFGLYALLLAGALLALDVVASAEHTRRWRQSSYHDFVKGTAHGIAIRSDGRLELAPKFAPLADADASYLWSVRLAPNGSLYGAGGSPAKVFRFDGAGAKPVVVFDSTDLAAQTIAFDSKGTLFVGTSPDGKVYKVSSTGEKSVFFDPKCKYIWDLAFGKDGTLYVATGDKGQIFAVTPDGKSTLLYASDEAHIRVLAFDKNSQLLAGSEPSGRVLRITPRTNPAKEKKSEKETDSAKKGSAEGYVLYESAKREVTALTVAADGTIYVAAIGEKQHTTGQAPTTVVTTPQGTTTFTNTGVVSGAAQPIFTAFPTLISSSIYQINPDGSPRELWTSREEVVYSLGLAEDGRLLAGTGNNGALLAIDKRGAFAQLAKAGAAQITGIAHDADGKTFVCTANPGKVFSVGPGNEAEGTYESHSFDAQMFSQWGRIEWWSPALVASASAKKNQRGSSGPDGPRLELFVRSGNTEDPGAEWSKWFGPYVQSGAVAEAPPARYVQWKAVVLDRPSGNGPSGDALYWVSVAYLPHNIAPVIDGIAIQDPGVRAQATFTVIPGQPQSVTLRQPPADNPSGTSGVIITQSSASPHFEPPPQGIVQKGYATVLWNAHDANDDDLKFAVYFRGENEHEWKLLKDKLDQKFYSWDTTSMPDGAYYLKIEATDAPSNPPAVALTAERESERFEVDNTPPVIDDLAVTGFATRGRSPISYSAAVKFTARDAATSIERAQYSVDGGDWILCVPVGQISDAPQQRYDFSITALRPGEHTIAVRAYDRFENVGSAKAVVTIPATE